jgi:hypothetical protein
MTTDTQAESRAALIGGGQIEKSHRHTVLVQERTKGSSPQMIVALLVEEYGVALADTTVLYHTAHC